MRNNITHERLHVKTDRHANVFTGAFLLERDDLSAWLTEGRLRLVLKHIQMTPDLAARILKLDEGNRPLRLTGNKRSVCSYSDAMARGEWEMNGETISISNTGKLINGQHRLHAVVRSGVTVPMLLVFGVTEASRNTVDQGAARSPSDILSMKGERNCAALAHAVQFVWAYDQPGSPLGIFRRALTPDQLVEKLDRNSGLRSAMTVGSGLRKALKLSEGAMAGIHYVCERIDPVSAQAFSDHVKTGLNITQARSAVNVLRKKYLLHLSRQAKLTTLAQAASFVIAFNAYRKRQTLTAADLNWIESGEGAQPFPRVA